MTVSQYRKTINLCSSSTVKIMYIMSVSMVIFYSVFLPTMTFFDGLSINDAFLIIFPQMMYIFLHMCLIERHPVFEGSVKPEKAVAFSQFKDRILMYQLPADRKTIIESYIGLDRFYAGMIIVSHMLTGAILIFKKTGIVTATILFLASLITPITILTLISSLKSGNGNKMSKLRNIFYFITMTLLLLSQLNIFTSGITDLIMGYDVYSPVSAVIGILIFVLGTVSLIIMNKLHKQLLSDNAPRAISGDFHETESQM